MSDQSPKAYYGKLHSVSLRTARTGNPFVRAELGVYNKAGVHQFNVQLISYKTECVDMLCSIGKDGAVWCLGFMENIPQQQGRYTARMLRVIQVRDSRTYVPQLVDTDT